MLFVPVVAEKEKPLFSAPKSRVYTREVRGSECDEEGVKSTLNVDIFKDRGDTRR